MKIEIGFLQTNVDLGHIFEGKNYDAKYQYRNIKVKEVEASCDCVQIKNETDVNRLVVQYRPGFPQHLIERGDKQYYTQKSIKVKYTIDGNDDIQVAVLLLNAKVMKR